RIFELRGPVRLARSGAVRNFERADEAGAVVRVEVRAADVGKRAAAVDVAAGDRATLGVAVLLDGKDHSVRRRGTFIGRRPRLEAARPLEHVPPIVLAAAARD